MEQHEIEALLILGVARELNASERDIMRIAAKLNAVSKAADPPQRKFKDEDGVWRDEDGRFAPRPASGRIATDVQRAGLAAAGLLGANERELNRVQDVAWGVNAFENMFRPPKDKPLGDRTIEALSEYSKLDSAALARAGEQLNQLETIYTNPALGKTATKLRGSLGGHELAIERMIKSDKLLREDPDLLEVFNRRHMPVGQRMDRLAEFYAHKAIDQQVTASLTKQRMPSLGSIVDTQTGQIHNMWMGDGDHRYLPFDAKEMRLAKDNFVLRSRMHGGLTEQDLFWGLSTNARGMAVANDTYQDGLLFTEHTRNSRRERVKVYRAFKAHKKHLQKEKRSAKHMVDTYSSISRDKHGNTIIRSTTNMSDEERRKRKEYYENKEQIDRLATMGESTMDSMALEMLQASHPEHIQRRTVKIGGKNNTKLEGHRKQAEKRVAERLGGKDGQIYAQRQTGGRFTSQSFSDFDGDSAAWLSIAEQIEEADYQNNTNYKGSGIGFWDTGAHSGQTVGIQMGREAIARGEGSKSPDEQKIYATLSPEAQRRFDAHLNDQAAFDNVLELTRPEVQRKDPSPVKYDPETRAKQRRIEQGKEWRRQATKESSPVMRAQQSRTNDAVMRRAQEASSEIERLKADLNDPELEPRDRLRARADIERNQRIIRNARAVRATQPHRSQGSKEQELARHLAGVRDDPNAFDVPGISEEEQWLIEREKVGKGYDLAEVIAINVRKRFSDSWAESAH